MEELKNCFYVFVSVLDFCCFPLCQLSMAIIEQHIFFLLFSFYFVVIQEYPVVHGLYHILFPPFTHPYKCFFFRLFHLLISSMVSVFLVSRCSDANLIDIPVEVETPDRHYYHVKTCLILHSFTYCWKTVKINFWSHLLFVSILICSLLSSQTEMWMHTRNWHG